MGQNRSLAITEEDENDNDDGDDEFGPRRDLTMSNVCMEGCQPNLPAR